MHLPYNKHTRSGDEGFALVELLVALTIIALLSLVTVSLTKSSINLFTRGQTQIMATTTVNRTQILLSDMLANALQPTIGSEARFAATAQKLSWTGAQSPFVPQPGLYNYDLIISAEAVTTASQTHNNTLLLKWQSLSLPERSGETVLATRLPALSFNYPDRPEVTNINGTDLPSSVRIAANETLRGQREQNYTWPALFIAFRFY